jgi:hypothetical protein
MWVVASLLAAAGCSGFGLAAVFTYRAAEDRPTWDRPAILLFLLTTGLLAAALWCAYTAAFLIASNLGA